MPKKALQLVKGINEPLDKMMQVILQEHVELHAAFHAIINHNNLSTHLDELGKSLEIHVRKEERELFPLIEASCNEVLLAAIDASLSPHA